MYLAGSIRVIAKPVPRPIIGIGEQDGRASALRPVQLSEEAASRIEGIIASNIFPFVENQIVRIPTAANDDVGYYVVAVAPSSLKHTE